MRFDYILEITYKCVEPSGACRYNTEGTKPKVVEMQPFRVSPEMLGGLEERLQFLGGHQVPVSPPCSPPAQSITPPSPLQDENSNIKKELSAGEKCDILLTFFSLSLSLTIKDLDFNCFIYTNSEWN